MNCKICNTNLANASAYAGTEDDIICMGCFYDEKLSYYEKHKYISDSLISHVINVFMNDEEIKDRSGMYSVFLRNDSSYEYDQNKNLVFTYNKVAQDLLDRGLEIVKEWRKDNIIGDILRDWVEIRAEFDKFSATHTKAIKNYWNAAKVKGHNADCGDIKILLWGCAGRIVFTLNTADCDISGIMTDEENNPLNANINGITGTKLELMVLMEKANKLQDLQFVPDNGVAPIAVHAIRASQE